MPARGSDADGRRQGHRQASVAQESGDRDYGVRTRSRRPDRRRGGGPEWDVPAGAAGQPSRQPLVDHWVPAPVRVPNQAAKVRKYRESAIGGFHAEKLLSCRDFGGLDTLQQSPENRGVPGSSPGLAIAETRGLVEVLLFPDRARAVRVMWVECGMKARSAHIAGSPMGS
jgi:hypothetical protein